MLLEVAKNSFSYPLTLLLVVLTRTHARGRGGGVSEHSQALKVNTSFISSRILSSIIKAVSKTICIILSVGAGLAPAVQSMQNEWH